MIALDIETVPNLELVGLLPEPEPDARLKDPEKIAADIVKKKAAYVEKAALAPETGMICCAAVWSPEQAAVLCSNDEPEILAFLVEYLRTDRQIVTWNGKAFDIPFIYKRMIFNHLAPKLIHPMSALTKRYTTFPHYDGKEIVSGGGKPLFPGIWRLDFYAKALLRAKKEDVDPKEIPGLMKTQQGRDAVASYCRHDAELAYCVVDKLRTVAG